MDSKNIGKKIREYRKKSNLTLEKFAELLDLSTTHIGNIERGSKTPTLETFIKIVNVLNVSSDVLIADKLNTKNEIKLTEISNILEELPDNEKERALDLFFSILNQFFEYFVFKNRHS